MSQALDNSLVSVKKLLPTQGPLEFFVHHNTFHEFENLPFKEGLLKGQNLYEGRVLKSINEYQEDLKSGKINLKILKKEITNFLKTHQIDEDHWELVQKILMIENGPADLTTKLDPPLEALRHQQYSKNKFYSKVLKELYDINIDDVISPLILRFFSLYFDHGVSYWSMPHREKGLIESFISFYAKSSLLSPQWEKQLSQLIKLTKNKPVHEKITYLLNELLIEPQYYTDYLFDLAYRYKGWAGLTISFEKHPEWNKNQDIKSSFDQFICLILFCETAFIANLPKRKRFQVEKSIPVKTNTAKYSFRYLNHINKLLRTTDNKDEQKLIVQLAEVLSDFERQYLLHLAFEESFYNPFLANFSHAQEKKSQEKVTPRFQILTCIDDREESFRRYIEEGRNDIETYGVAGHFGLDIKFKGIFNAHQRALCPDIVTPTKVLNEEIVEGLNAQKIYKAWSAFLWAQNHGSKTLIRGFIFQFLLGFTSLFSLTIHILFPFTTSRIGENMKSKLNNKIKTKLIFQNDSIDGFNLDDMVRYARNLLKTIGLLDHFSPTIVILGHGSHSLNNPHESAYNCGACGGGKGAPNARLISTILNDLDVRKALTKENINIPDETIFLPGFHNTCSDEVSFSDIVQRPDVIEIIDHLKQAAKKDAKERCRRFPDVRLDIKSEDAFNHCLGRANNYMEARPEYNHATNAFCIVGPRQFSQKLFLDRRAFLVSYEESQDNESSDILKNILSAVGPVCTGINLEYYFSFMDNEVYGCGTKLPHNVTSLLGVMNGYQSDLRMGLSQQMIEIHDPYRLMLLIVAKPQKVLYLLSVLKSFDHLSNNSWMHLSVYDSEEGALYRYIDNKMVKQDFSMLPEKIYSSNFSAFHNNRQSCDLGILKERT